MNNEEALLTRLGIINYNKIKDEYLADCVFCGDKKQNLQINFVKEVFHCWVCGIGGSIFKMINIITGLEKKDAIRLFRLDEIDVKHSLGITLQLLDKRRKVYDHNQFRVKPRPKYWKNLRGIKKEMVQLFELGFDSYTNRLVIPLLEDDRCFGLVRRAISDEQKPKYLTTEGFDKSNFIFGWDLVGLQEDYIVVTEGCIDAIIARQLGLNAVSIMGVDLTQNNLERLADNYDRVMLMFDNDVAGESATEKASRSIIEYGGEAYRIEYDGEDPGSLTNIKQVKSYVKCSIL